MLALANPIYKHAPQEYFPAAPALMLAQAIRANDVASIDAVFAQRATMKTRMKKGGIAEPPFFISSAKK